MRERELYLPTVKRAAAAAAPAAAAAARPARELREPAGRHPAPPTRPARPSPGEPAGRGFAPGGRGVSGVPGGGVASQRGGGGGFSCAQHELLLRQPPVLQIQRRRVPGTGLLRLPVPPERGQEPCAGVRARRLGAGLPARLSPRPRLLPPRHLGHLQLGLPAEPVLAELPRRRLQILWLRGAPQTVPLWGSARGERGAISRL